MPATIVVGGQYGSEGKGKVVALIASESKEPWVVRCGGPNSGHTVTIKGVDVVLRQIPSCAEPWKARFFIAAGCVVDEDILGREIEMLQISPEQITVDTRAVLVTQGDRESEARSLHGIASTCSGTGAALIRRMSRSNEVALARDSLVLKRFCRVEPVAPLLHDTLADGGDVIIEGTQGFALSLLHGTDYPYVTSRDTTAAAFAMEAGLSPRHITKVMMVVRTFPIRVGGSSGPFSHEISWEKIREMSGAPETVGELTSVTKRLRRVALFDIAAVQLACKYNHPDAIAVMGLDRLDYANTAVTEEHRLTPNAREFIDQLELETGVRVEYAGTGFGTFNVVRLNIVAKRNDYSHV